MVPLDGSELALAALSEAERLAQGSGARLVLVRSAVTRPFRATYGTHDAAMALREAEDYLEEVASGPRERGIDVETRAEYGEPEETLGEAARHEGVDLIVMATHGRSGVGRWVYGSTTQTVLCDPPAPVLLVRAWDKVDSTERTVPERPLILVSLDGSAFAEEALPAARELADSIRGDLVLLRVVTPGATTTAPILVGEGNTLAYLSDEVPILYAEAEFYLDDIAEGLAKDGRRVDKEVRVGSPAETITATARELSAGYIVMSTHGRTGTARAVLGSTADAVVRKGDVPTLMVRPGPITGGCSQTDQATVGAAEQRS
jgi:nucleotide-binding universal stress UspA family protein